MADILITGGTIITMDPDRRVIDDGAVAVEGDRIVAVGPRAEVEAQHTAARTIDAHRKVIMPGLIDAHGHAGHGLVKTLAGGYSSVWAETTDRIYAAFGSDRMLMASDWPWIRTEPGYPETLGVVDQLLGGISAAERDMIRGGTAMSLFNFG